MPLNKFLICFFLLLQTLSGASNIITIATASNSGLYYPSGGAICRLFNVNNQNVRCIVETTPGSSYNINAIEGGINNFAFVQADELLGYITNMEKQERKSEIKVVFPFYTEAFVMIASSQSGIETIADIKGKTINIGVEGSGVRNFTSRLVSALNLKSTDFKNISTEDQSSAEQMVCANMVDASFFISGQPNSMIQSLVENCGAKIIPLSEEAINGILNQNSYYTVVKIPSGMYAFHNRDIHTIGTKSVLITSTLTNDEITYELVKNIAHNFDSFKQYSPVTERMLVNELNSPLPHLEIHPSAIKALSEAGVK